MNILAIGKNSYVASGFNDLINQEGLNITWFSRGPDSILNNVVFGSTENILQNNYFDDNYDCLINFAVLKDKSIQDNIVFISNLLNLAKNKGVKKFIHFSTVMVYPYNKNNIDENSKMEESASTWKGHYAKIKIAVDDYILKNISNYDFDICLLRPGYVYDDLHQPSFSKKIFSRYRLLFGDKKSIMPTISKDDLHVFLVKLVTSQSSIRIAHVFADGGTNRYYFSKFRYPSAYFIILPSWLFKIIPIKLVSFFRVTRLFYSRIESVFMTTEFNSRITTEFIK